MQLTPRYLVNERTIVISNDAGFITEYRPVYSRTLNVFRGIDNRLQFRLLNADQKAVVITGTPIFVAFDEEQNLVIQHECTVTDDASSANGRGMFEVTITENDLLRIQQQYLTYNIYIEEEDDRRITYADRAFNSAGKIFVDGNAFPGARPSIEVTTFYYNNNKWYAGDQATQGLPAQPGINGNEALHTLAIYSTGYVGTVQLQATLDNQLVGVNDWADVDSVTLDGTEIEPVVINFNGIFSYIRLVFDQDPNSMIKKILIRN